MEKFLNKTDTTKVLILIGAMTLIASTLLAIAPCEACVTISETGDTYNVDGSGCIN